MSAIGDTSTTQDGLQVPIPPPPLPAGGVARRGRRQRAGGGAALGLSTAHISPWYRRDRLVKVVKWNSGFDGSEPYYRETFHLGDAPPIEFDNGQATFWQGGNLVRCRRPYSKSTLKRGPGGLRGKITTFTRASRRSLLRKIATVRRDKLPIFITLTYPGQYPLDPLEWKRHLDNFCKRLHRRCPQAGWFWRLEPQKRGAPHFHLLAWGIKLDADFRAWLSAAWYAVVGSGDERHLKAGTRAENVRSPKGVMAYAAKYLAKMPEAPEGEDIPDWGAVGRWWGLRHPEFVPWATPAELLLPDHVAYRLMDALLAHAGLPDGSWRCVTVFGVADEWLEWVNSISPPW